MKIRKTHSKTPVASSMKVMAADLQSIGTVYYRVLAAQIESAYEDEDPFIYYAVLEDGLDAINLDTMVGSKVIDDELFICQSDGQEININGEMVDPFVALEDYTPEDLEDYIEDVDQKFILDNITIYEINRKSILNNIDDAAKDALDRGYSFTNIVKYYDEDLA